MAALIFRFVLHPALLFVLAAAMLGLCAHGIYRARRSVDGTELSWWRRTAMAVLVVIIGATPATLASADEVTTNAEIYIVVDRTGSMAAEDYNGQAPRLVGVRTDINALTEAFAGSRFSIIGWDSSATRQLPLTSDTTAVKAWAEGLRQEITAYSGGSAIDRPAELLTRVLAQSKKQNPQNVRLVFFLSDGENTDGDTSSKNASPQAFTKAAPYVDGGAVLGYGTPQGGKMKQWFGREIGKPTYISGSDGKPALSRIDEGNLRDLAAVFKVTYLHRAAPSSLKELSSSIDVKAISQDGRNKITVYRDLYWPFVWALVGILAWEAFAQLRALRLIGGERNG